jgi:hypothetical protein
MLRIFFVRKKYFHVELDKEFRKLCFSISAATSIRGFKELKITVLYSLVEGVGKSKRIELIENVIGEKYSYSITDVSNQLFGKHAMAEFEKTLFH